MIFRSLWSLWYHCLESVMFTPAEDESDGLPVPFYADKESYVQTYTQDDFPQAFVQNDAIGVWFDQVTVEDEDSGPLGTFVYDIVSQCFRVHF